MSSAVIYQSMTGHSRKIAEAVAAALQVEAQAVGTATLSQDDQLLFIVGGIYGGKSHPKLLSWLAQANLQHVRLAVLMGSSMGKKEQPMLRAALEARGIQVLAEEFHCLGSFLFMGLGHPNQQELAEAAAFAVRVLATFR